MTVRGREARPDLSLGGRGEEGRTEPEADEGAHADAPRPSEIRILVVDDNADNRYVIAVAMEHAGYTVDTAVDGDEALRRAREHRPDIVLLDLMMPRVDGWETIRRLRQMPWDEEPIVIAVTARTDPGIAERLRANGFSAYVAKPFTLDHLLQLVERALSLESGPEWIDYPSTPFGAS